MDTAAASFPHLHLPWLVLLSLTSWNCVDGAPFTRIMPSRVARGRLSSPVLPSPVKGMRRPWQEASRDLWLEGLSGDGPVENWESDHVTQIKLMTQTTQVSENRVQHTPEPPQSDENESVFSTVIIPEVDDPDPEVIDESMTRSSLPFAGPSSLLNTLIFRPSRLVSHFLPTPSMGTNSASSHVPEQLTRYILSEISPNHISRDPLMTDGHTEVVTFITAISATHLYVTDRTRVDLEPLISSTSANPSSSFVALESDAQSKANSLLGMMPSSDLDDRVMTEHHTILSHTLRINEEEQSLNISSLLTQSLDGPLSGQLSTEQALPNLTSSKAFQDSLSSNIPIQSLQESSKSPIPPFHDSHLENLFTNPKSETFSLEMTLDRSRLSTTDSEMTSQDSLSLKSSFQTISDVGNSKNEMPFTISSEKADLQSEQTESDLFLSSHFLQSMRKSDDLVMTSDDTSLSLQSSITDSKLFSTLRISPTSTTSELTASSQPNDILSIFTQSGTDLPLNYTKVTSESITTDGVSSPSESARIVTITTDLSKLLRSSQAESTISTSLDDIAPSVLSITGSESYETLNTPLPEPTISQSYHSEMISTILPLEHVISQNITQESSSPSWPPRVQSSFETMETESARESQNTFTTSLSQKELPNSITTDIFIPNSSEFSTPDLVSFTKSKEFLITTWLFPEASDLASRPSSNQNPVTSVEFSTLTSLSASRTTSHHFTIFDFRFTTSPVSDPDAPSTLTIHDGFNSQPDYDRSEREPITRYDESQSILPPSEDENESLTVYDDGSFSLHVEKSKMKPTISIPTFESKFYQGDSFATLDEPSMSSDVNQYQTHLTASKDQSIPYLVGSNEDAIATDESVLLLPSPPSWHETESHHVTARSLPNEIDSNLVESNQISFSDALQDTLLMTDGSDFIAPLSASTSFDSRKQNLHTYEPSINLRTLSDKVFSASQTTMMPSASRESLSPEFYDATFTVWQSESPISPTSKTEGFYISGAQWTASLDWQPRESPKDEDIEIQHPSVASSQTATKLLTANLLSRSYNDLASSHRTGGVIRRSAHSSLETIYAIHPSQKVDTGATEDLQPTPVAHITLEASMPAKELSREWPRHSTFKPYFGTPLILSKSKDLLPKDDVVLTTSPSSEEEQSSSLSTIASSSVELSEMDSNILATQEHPLASATTWLQESSSEASATYAANWTSMLQPDQSGTDSKILISSLPELDEVDEMTETNDDKKLESTANMMSLAPLPSDQSDVFSMPSETEDKISLYTTLINSEMEETASFETKPHPSAFSSFTIRFQQETSFLSPPTSFVFEAHSTGTLVDEISQIIQTLETNPTSTTDEVAISYSDSETLVPLETTPSPSDSLDATRATFSFVDQHLSTHKLSPSPLIHLTEETLPRATPVITQILSHISTEFVPPVAYPPHISLSSSFLDPSRYSESVLPSSSNLWPMSEVMSPPSLLPEQTLRVSSEQLTSLPSYSFLSSHFPITIHQSSSRTHDVTITGEISPSIIDDAYNTIQPSLKKSQLTLIPQTSSEEDKETNINRQTSPLQTPTVNEDITITFYRSVVAVGTTTVKPSATLGTSSVHAEKVSASTRSFLMTPTFEIPRSVSESSMTIITPQSSKSSMTIITLQSSTTVTTPQLPFSTRTVISTKPETSATESMKYSFSTKADSSSPTVIARRQDGGEIIRPTAAKEGRPESATPDVATSQSRKAITPSLESSTTSALPSASSFITVPFCRRDQSCFSHGVTTVTEVTSTDRSKEDNITEKRTTGYQDTTITTSKGETISSQFSESEDNPTTKPFNAVTDPSEESSTKEDDKITEEILSVTMDTISSSPDSLINPTLESLLKDKYYWILTVLEAPPQLPDNFTNMMEIRLASAYRLAFRQRMKRDTADDLVAVKILSLTNDRLQRQLHLVYIVEHDGLLVPAALAAATLNLLRHDQLREQLGYHVIVKAKPYQPPVQEAPPSVVPTSAIIGGICGSLLFLLCCLWFYCRCCRPTSDTASVQDALQRSLSAYGQHNRRQMFHQGSLQFTTRGRGHSKDTTAAPVSPKADSPAAIGGHRPLPAMPQEVLGREKETRRMSKRLSHVLETTDAATDMSQGCDNLAFREDQLPLPTAEDEKSPMRRSRRKPLAPDDPQKAALNADLQGGPDDMFHYVPSSPPPPVKPISELEEGDAVVPSTVPPIEGSQQSSSPATSRADTVTSESSKAALLPTEHDYMVADTLSDTDTDAAEAHLHLARMRRRISELLDDAFALAGGRHMYGSLRNKKINPSPAEFQRFTSFRSPGHRAQSAAARYTPQELEKGADGTNRPQSADLYHATSFDATCEAPYPPKPVWSASKEQMLQLAPADQTLSQYPDIAQSERKLPTDQNSRFMLRTSRSPFGPSSSLPMLDTLHELPASPTAAGHLRSAASELYLAHSSNMNPAAKDEYDEIDVISALRDGEPVAAVIQAIKDELQKFNSSLPGANQNESFA